MMTLPSYRGDADYPWGQWWRKVVDTNPGWAELITVDTYGKAAGIRKRINSGLSPFGPKGCYQATVRYRTVYARIIK